MYKGSIAVTLSVLMSNPAQAEGFREKALLAMEALSCSYAAQTLENTDEAKEFLELGSFITAHIYSKFDEWEASASTAMPLIFGMTAEGLEPPLSDREVSDLTYHTVQFLMEMDRSSDEREKEKKREAGMEVGQLFGLEHELATERWEGNNCASIKDRYLK